MRIFSFNVQEAEVAGTPYVRPVEDASAAPADAAGTSIWVRGVAAAALSDDLKQTVAAFKQWDAVFCKVCGTFGSDV